MVYLGNIKKNLGMGEEPKHGEQGRREDDDRKTVGARSQSVLNVG